MRFWVAHNRTAPIAVLERLVRDHDEQVRLRLAQRRKLPDHLRELLATDSDEAVVAENARRWTDQK